MSLKNAPLYEGCEIKEVGGRLTLTTPLPEAINIVGRNAIAIVAGTEDRSEVTLTGPMAVWAYLLSFHAAVHSFGKVYYHDGRNNPVLISQH